MATADNYLDNIFGPGGFLGGAPEDTEAQIAQGELLKRLMDREGELYPLLMGEGGLLSQMQGNEDLASGALTSEINQLYPGVQSDITGLKLPPATLEALNNLRKSRMTDLEDQSTRLIGSDIANLNRRGMMSSSDAEGMGGRVASALAPQIGQAESEYWNARTTMPGELATKRYSLGASQGALRSDALRTQYQDVLNPYLDMWRSAATVGATTPSTNQDPGQGGQNLMSLAGTIAKFV